MRIDILTLFDEYMDTLTRGNKDMQRFLLQFVGACLSNVPGYKLKKMVFLVGPGDTGKSQLKRLVELLLGEGLITDTADLYAHAGEQECNRADQRDRQPDVDTACHSKADAYCQGINAGSHRHRKHCLCGKVRLPAATAFFLLFEGFPQHICTDQGKQAEGDPMVYAFNIACK